MLLCVKDKEKHLLFSPFYRVSRDERSVQQLITASNNDFISTPGSAAGVLCARVRRNATSVLSLDNLPTVGLQDAHRGGLPRLRVPPRPRHVSRGVLPVHAGWPGRLDDRGNTCRELVT